MCVKEGPHCACRVAEGTEREEKREESPLRVRVLPSSCGHLDAWTGDSILSEERRAQVCDDRKRVGVAILCRCVCAVL